MSKIEISGIGHNLAVKVDGALIPVRSADLHVDCESPPQLTITTEALGLHVQTEGDVQVDEFAASALKALGWTPPADDGTKPQTSDGEPDDKAIERWIQRNPKKFEMWVQINDAIRRHQDHA